MHSVGAHNPNRGGDLSHESSGTHAHRMSVTGPGTEPAAEALPESHAAQRGKRFYNALSASSVGLELGLSVVIALLFGMWLDSKLGTQPWLMLLWLCFGLAAGFRGVLRAVRRSDRAAERDQHG